MTFPSLPRKKAPRGIWGGAPRISSGWSWGITRALLPPSITSSIVTTPFMRPSLEISFATRYISSMVPATSNTTARSPDIVGDCKIEGEIKLSVWIGANRPHQNHIQDQIPF